MEMGGAATRMPAWKPPRRRRLWLMRHGAVDYFAKPGADFSSPELSSLGIVQALAAGALLVQQGIDLLVTSGLPRTRHTASLVLPGCQAVEDSRWREIEPGKLAALPQGATPDPAALQAILHTLGPGLTDDSRFLQGETFGAARTRVGEAVTDLLADPGWQQCLVVAHSVSLRLALLHLLNAPLDSVCRLEQDAGCLNLVEIDPQGLPLVRLVNFTPPSPSKELHRHSSLEELLLQFLTPQSSTGRS